MVNRQILIKIGLSEREAEIYELLLKLGESPVSDLLKKTQVHPQIIYRAIDGLASKKLITISHRKYRQYIRAEDPHFLEKIEEDRLEELKKTLPDLLALQKSSKDAVVRVDKGNEAIRSMRIKAIDVLKTNEIFYIIGGGAEGKFIGIMAGLHKELEQKRIKKGIIKKMISFKNQKKLVEKTNPFKELTENRYLPENYPTPSSTFIYSNFVSLVVWSEVPLVINIESEEISQSYKQYFEYLWQ